MLITILLIMLLFVNTFAAVFIYFLSRDLRSFYLAAFNAAPAPEPASKHTEMSEEDRKDFLDADKEVTEAFYETLRTFNEFMTGEERDIDVGQQDA